MNAYPLVLALPNGVRAQLVDDSGLVDAPRYEIDGELTDIDVMIPPDLAERWFWHGSFLTMRTHPAQCGICIATSTYPPPGWPAPRHDCFESARIIEATSAAIAADFAEARPKKAKRPVRATVGLQLEMML
jgi:hypothetical protein